MENSIAKQSMKYIREQIVTNGEIQQMRLADAAKKQEFDLEISNLDLSKWNLKFRHALVYLKFIHRRIGITIFSTSM